MVAINRYRWRFVAVLLIVVSSLCGVAEATAADQTGRYEALVAKSAELKSREDSLSRLVNERRRAVAVAETAEVREAVGAEVVALEMELFDVGRERSGVASELSSLAQGGLSGAQGGGVQGEGAQEGGGRQISSAELLRMKLPQEDYAKLVAAEAAEAECGEMFAEYMTTYNRLRELKQLYDQAKVESEAIGYAEEFRKVEELVAPLSALLASCWGEIYDSKNYAYSMALELLSDEALMSKQTELAMDTAAKIGEVEHGEVSRAALNYDYQKRAQTAFELALAKRLTLTKAVDSLRSVATLQHQTPAVEDLSEVTFAKRNFIIYEPIKFVTTTPYSAKNPIPMAKEYKQGEIYRIQYGAYKYEQQPSIFRGVVPLSKDRALGFWTYYGGGYETLEEAKKAVELCKRRGFNRPEIVRWRDGVRRNLFREPETAAELKGDGLKYRVQISGAAVLPDIVKTAIKSGAPDAELSKIGADKFVVGIVVGRVAADRLVAGLKVADETLEYSIVEVK
ncbi:MAG: hypothetical protein SNG14_03565 [Rikenellaceae bacterium]